MTYTTHEVLGSGVGARAREVIWKGLPKGGLFQFTDMA